MIVRPATRADVPAMRDLQGAIIAAGGTTAYLVPFSEAGFIASYLTPPATICCFIAMDDAGLVGFQALSLWDGLPDGWADIGTFIAPDRQRTGAGAALFAATMAAARAAGIATINATIRCDNAAGLGFYARRGFVDYATDPAWRLADGTVVGRVSRRFEV